MAKIEPVEPLRDRLVDVAGRGETITYDELLTELGLEGDIVPLLRALSVSEDDTGRGLLTAVVVRDDTGRPGAGWFRLAAERGRDVTDPVRAWQAERARLWREHGAGGGR